MQAQEILTDLVKSRVNDIFCIAGSPISYRQDNQIMSLDGDGLSPDRTYEFISQIYQLANERSMERLLAVGDDDFSFAVKGVSRFRANVYKQRGSLAAVIRIVPFELPRAAELNIPERIVKLAELRHGLVLFSGTAGSGKSTTLATIIDRINNTRNAHIVTLENPIEFLHKHRQSLVSQREVQIDTEDYASALRAAMRQAPDVILIGELRDPESISIALTAAETGHLVFSTLHTLGAVNAVDRLLNSFDPNQQVQVRMQLSMVLVSVVSQQLVQKIDGGVLPVFEIMHCTIAVRNLIREGRTHQLAQVIDTSADAGMVGMDASLLKLYQDGLIDSDEMLTHALVPDNLTRFL
ncbi:MAG: PilT/PilU family type 4a pilus ATPase [Coriobacteriales bacterium]|jgi:twitching motility protein PilT|nr:PilT/PilU family type 4a pilus ATPase [Coriobacteriales bacterium]